MGLSTKRLRRDARGVWQDLFQGGKGGVLLAVAAGWFLSLGLRYVYPSMIPFFRGFFGFDLTVAGLLLSGLWVAYALGQVPGGVIGDRFGEGNVLVLSTALASTAVLLVAVSLNLVMLFLSTVAFGFATALFGPTRFTVLTDLYSERAGTAIGLTYAAGSIGNAVLPAAAAAIATYTTWRLGFLWLFPAFVAVTIAIWLLVPSSTSTVDHAVDELSLGIVPRIVGQITVGGIPIVVGIHILLGFVSQGFLGFYPTYLVEIKDFSPQVAAVLFSLYFAFGAVVQPVAGLSRDRFGSQFTLLVICLAYLLGMVALYFAVSFLHVVILTFFLSYRNGTGVITNTFIADTLPDEIKGTGLGILRTTWIAIGASGPIFVGYLGDLGILRSVILLLAAIVGVATVMTLFIPRDEPQG